MKRVNPMPAVTYKGDTYKLTSRKTVVPDLEAMSIIDAHLWLIRNTRAKGYQKAPNPLRGMAGVITLTERS